jgi:tRNA (cytidine/uridine-2'-O-)-methyltransferase
MGARVRDCATQAYVPTGTLLSHAKTQSREGKRAVLKSDRAGTSQPPSKRADRASAFRSIADGTREPNAPEAVHERANVRVRIPQVEGTRSLNLAVAAGIGVAEAVRQTGSWVD